MNQAFVIFGMGRTGSSLLVSLLNSHPQIHCEGELFRLGRWRRPRHPLARLWQHHRALSERLQPRFFIQLANWPMAASVASSLIWWIEESGILRCPPFASEDANSSIHQMAVDGTLARQDGYDV